MNKRILRKFQTKLVPWYVETVHEVFINIHCVSKKQHWRCTV